MHYKEGAVHIINSQAAKQFFEGSEELCIIYTNRIIPYTLTSYLQTANKVQFIVMHIHILIIKIWPELSHTL